jgi:hypothetical protein
MRPEPSRAPLQQRIYQQLAEELTARMEGEELSWPAVRAAERRIRARVRLFIGRHLEVPDTHPAMAEALTALAGEAPEQAVHDEALMRRWCQAQGVVVEAGARDRVLTRLETMAARQRAAGERDGL